MISLRNFTLLTLLAVGQTAAFQPMMRRRSSASITPLSRIAGKPASSVTMLSAFQTEQAVVNATEVSTMTREEEENNMPILTPDLIQDINQQQQGIKKLNGALFVDDDNDMGTTDLMIVNQEAAEEKEMMSPLEGLLWKGSVVLLCALWASNFPVAKLIMSEPGVDSSLYAVTRFSVAALALAPGAISSTRKNAMDWDTFKGAIICGSWVAFGYLGQTLGLMSTTASKSCVICSLHCVFVAAIAEWLRVNKAKESSTEAVLASSSSVDETKYDFKRLIPAAIAVTGVAVVELKGAAGGANIGDLLSAAQPIGFGLGYLLLEDLMAKRPDTALAVSFVKLAVVALASFAMFELTPLLTQSGGGGLESWSFAVPDFSPILASPMAMAGIFYTGIITTALALWIESIAFARVSATDASLILTTEPLFAAAVAAVTLGETFGLSDYAGASLIIGACVLATLMDSEHRDESCEVADEDCESPRQTPLGGM